MHNIYCDYYEIIPIQKLKKLTNPKTIEIHSLETHYGLHHRTEKYIHLTAQISQTGFVPQDIDLQELLKTKMNDITAFFVTFYCGFIVFPIRFWRYFV